MVFFGPINNNKIYNVVNGKNLVHSPVVTNTFCQYFRNGISFIGVPLYSRKSTTFSLLENYMTLHNQIFLELKCYTITFDPPKVAKVIII